MKLHEISMKNFRQFYGEETIELASDEHKNVTLIHAENGVGKTTLLNAVLWAFYDQTTNRFEDPEQIINFEAKKEGSTEAKVAIEFSNLGKDYLVQRHHLESRNGKRDKVEQQFKAFEIVDGNHKSIPNGVSFVNQVIPQEISKYFFFDGEHAENFSAVGNRKLVGQAVRNILGCGIAELAIDDLDKAAKSYNREAGQIPGDDYVRQLEKKRQSLELEGEQAVQLKDEIEGEIEAKTKQINIIETKLREVEGVKVKQKLRDQVKRELKEATLHLNEAKSERVNWVGRHAIDVVSKRLAETSLNFVEEKDTRAEIPSPYNKEIVDKLLSRQMCICERPLKHGTPEYAAVMNQLKTSADAELRRRVSRVRSKIISINEKLEEVPLLLEHAQIKLGKWVQKVDECERRLKEISQEIKGLDIEEIKEREIRRTSLGEEIETLRRQLVRVQVDEEDRKLTIKRLEKDRDEIIATNARASRLTLRRDLAKKAAEQISLHLDNHEVRARKEIIDAVNKILDETARREYLAELSADFSLGLKTKNGQNVPRSGGENQLLSLAFIGALINFSRERSKGSGDFLIPGTVAPLMLDSPFGQLDKEYRSSTASFIPELAEQVVLLVSSSQGDEEVVDKLKDRIGAEYVLVSENSGDRKGRPEDRISLNGKEYIRSIWGAERNRTKIIPVL